MPRSLALGAFVWSEKEEVLMSPNIMTQSKVAGNFLMRILHIWWCVDATMAGVKKTSFKITL